ncbi:hypothetical protein ADU59_11755 [Pararhizobium polonicum]|uniref:Uncharacterized protein n=1 Tax=Pararhizobium polonicum TaxID=1612624 RepID=A0A1C7P200_9HYPH|nr:hypothetical protein ADU59_11755 [Pararhizobium polonicum]
MESRERTKRPAPSLLQMSSHFRLAGIATGGVSSRYLTNSSPNEGSADTHGHVRLWADVEIRKNLVVIKTFFEFAVEFFTETETIGAFTFIEQWRNWSGLS